MKRVKLFTIIVLVFSLLLTSATISHAESISTSSIVYEYFDYVGGQQFENLLHILAYEDRAEFASFINNIENQSNKLGYYNYKRADIISCSLLGEYQTDMSNISSNKLNQYTNWKCWECIVDIVPFKETKYLNTGYNRFWVYTAHDTAGTELVVEVCRDASYPYNIDDNITIAGIDTPVSNPIVGVWANPSTINVQGYGEVNFKQYCRIVAACEFGGNGRHDEARKAVAMAVKQVGWNRTLVQKYPNLGYDVTATTNDQVYNPSVSESQINNVTQAVDDIWEYVMLTYDKKLFYSSYRANSSSYATYHGGMLSQNDANSLANSGYSWEDILHYFYDYGTYISGMSQGEILIIHFDHTPVGFPTATGSNMVYHNINCTVCGCSHGKINHTWNYFNNIYTCSACGKQTTTPPPSILTCPLQDS